ncbi:hypothetical protein D3C77_437100 [compost metagenome]
MCRRIDFAVDASDVLVVASQRFVGGIGNAVLQYLQIEHPQERIAAADLRVEEAKGKAGVHRLDPERDLGQFHRHRVAVHPVDAAARDIAQGMAEIGQRGSAFGPDARKPRGDATSGCQQEVA